MARLTGYEGLRPRAQRPFQHPWSSLKLRKAGAQGGARQLQPSPQAQPANGGLADTKCSSSALHWRAVFLRLKLFLFFLFFFFLEIESGHKQNYKRRGADLGPDGWTECSVVCEDRRALLPGTHLTSRSGEGLLSYYLGSGFIVLQFTFSL